MGWGGGKVWQEGVVVQAPSLVLVSHLVTPGSNYDVHEADGLRSCEAHFAERRVPGVLEEFKEGSRGAFPADGHGHAGWLVDYTSHGT